MQMFHLSSMKMGLDQAVLQGFENGSGEGALSKSEVEKLLKHGAYDMLTEEKDGKSEKESTEFVQQDIDSILERRATKIVHDDAGGKRSGGTFSKASFKITKSADKAGSSNDVDIDDPDFWKKMLGDTYEQHENTYLDPKQRRKGQLNYSEDTKLDFEKSPGLSDKGDSDFGYQSEDGVDEDGENFKRVKRGGSSKSAWTKEEVEKVERFLCSFGYGNVPWPTALRFMNLQGQGEQEVS